MTPQVPTLAKYLMRAQNFLLRRNWMGVLGEEIMVINVVGRKSGQPYATPIGYLRDGEQIIGLTNQDPSNWYLNALQAGQVTLEIKGQARRARIEKIVDPQERQRIFDLYRQERASNFPRLFGLSVAAPESELQAALATRRFVRFIPIQAE